MKCEVCSELLEGYLDGELASGDIQIVRPFEVDCETGRRLDGFRHRHAGRERQQPCRAIAAAAH